MPIFGPKQLQFTKIQINPGKEESFPIDELY